MKTLIPHHLEAIDMSKEAVHRAYNRELIDMARDMIRAQSAEMRTMRTWLCPASTLEGFSAPVLVVVAITAAADVIPRARR